MRDPAVKLNSCLPYSLFIIVMLLLAGISLPEANSMTSDDDDDQAAILIAIQKEIGVTKWRTRGSSSSDYCSWLGIQCGADHKSVEGLDLSHSYLGAGNLSVISNLKQLKRLDLSNNEFLGTIPPAFGQWLSQLEFLDLSWNNFEGFIPSELGNLVNLRVLNLSNNLLSGVIPDELESLTQLRHLHLSSNRLNGSIPYWVGNLTQLRVFTAYENGLVGVIPANLGSVSGIEMLNLHSNQLEGVIPDTIFAHGTLQTLVLTDNRLNGSLPESIGKCKDLSSIRIGNNQLVGKIPVSVGNITSLTYFEANNNKNLSGDIVEELALCPNLTLLNLASNRFTGVIPSTFGVLENLQELIVSGNSLYGDIPSSILTGCKSLNKLDLSSNGFNGTIPEDICQMPRLQFLYLDHNSIAGEIPRRIGDCSKLLELRLGSNYLTGSIPPDIGRLRNLQIELNVSLNHLRGKLPSELGRLDKLVSLDLSSNQISGTIPQELKGMLSLIEVNFSNNLLTGPVPTFVPFQKSPNSSFTGNSGLCGPPLSSSCGPSYGNDAGDYPGDYTRRGSYRIVLAVVGSGLAVFLSVSIVVFLFMMRERQEKSAAAAKKGEEVVEEAAATVKKDPPMIIAGNVFVENLKQAVDFDAVVQSTFKDSNKLSNGTFSCLYKATMPSGLVILVRCLKSIDRTVIHHQNRMIRELERLSRISHDHLMKPIGFVIYEDVALLLHEFMANGTLSQYLHPSNNNSLDHEAPKLLEPADWPRRLSIAIGVAEGLAFLHSVAVIHLDVSSGNVLLDGNYRPLVAEIEISKLLDPSRGTASISAVAGSFGYIAPEYAFTMQVTAPGNVYSYGVILLEILTSRLPVEESFGDGRDLVKWVHSAPSRGETPEQILDPKLSTVSFSWRKEMLAALKVALLCTDNTPAKRPKMKKVVEMLQEINQS